MSKRLQILLPEKEFNELRKVCKKHAVTVAEWVRASIRTSLESSRPIPVEQRIETLLKFAENRGPTGEIDEILSAIEKGRNQ